MSNGKSSHQVESSGAARAGVGGGPGNGAAAEPAGVRVAVARHEFGGAAPGGAERVGSGADIRAGGLPRGDARDHLDLFVGPIGAVAGDPDARVALTWRLPLAAWGAEGLACGRFAATPLEPHRAAYLSIASVRELADGRGRVVPLARGDGTLEMTTVGMTVGMTAGMTVGTTAEVVSASERTAVDAAAGDRPVAPALRVVALGRRIEIRDGFAVIAAIEPDPPAARRGLGIADDPPPASKENP